MCKGNFLKLAVIKFEKKVSEVRKWLKTNFWILDFGRKTEKYMLAPQEVIFSGYNQEMHKKKFFKLVWVRIEKQAS